MASPIWSKVILIGDSLTGHGFDVNNGCWIAMLANSLVRISDVVSRGFSGYSSRSIRTILPSILGKEEYGKAAVVGILLGANDCTDSCWVQHVPTNQYKDNLKAIVDHIRRQGVSSDKIILMTPPCYIHEDWAAANSDPVPMRTPKDYVPMVKQVASEMGVECIDLDQVTSSHPNPRSLLVDGLHFNRAGAQVVYNVLWPAVSKRVAAFHGSLDPKFPRWEIIEAQGRQNNPLPSST